MKRLFLASLALLAMCGASQASITANAYLSITNLKVINVATNAPVVDGVDIIVSPGEANSLTTAQLVGIGSDFDFKPLSLDAEPSYVGNGTAPTQNQIFGVLPTTLGSPAGLQLSAIEHYALADTAPGPGIAVSTTTTPAAGASNQSFAEVSLDHTIAPVLGSAATTATGGSSVLRLNFITGNSPITVRIDFDAMRQIYLDYSNAPPNGLYLNGSTTFSISIDGSGNPSPGVVVPLAAQFEPADLNATFVNTTGGLQAQHLFSDSFSTQDVTLLANGSYSFTITQGSAASVGVVPEPASMIAWSVLGACVALPSLYRRIKK